MRRTCSFLLELLAAIPSVIFGFWAVDFLARRGLAPTYEFFGLKTQSGEGIVAAGLVLAVMILPYITALSYDVCQAVPRSQREGSLSLGATRWQTIWRVVLPYARPGIIAACFLALGRAVGETMAVTMVIGNAQHLDFSLTATGDSIPSIIAKQLHETGPADTSKRAVLIALGLLLLAITLVMNVTARLLVRWASKPRVRPTSRISCRRICRHRPRQWPRGDACPAPRGVQQPRHDRRASLVPVAHSGAALPHPGLHHVHGAGQVTGAFFTSLPNDNPPGLITRYWAAQRSWRWHRHSRFPSDCCRQYS